MDMSIMTPTIVDEMIVTGGLGAFLGFWAVAAYWVERRRAERREPAPTLLFER